MKKIGSLTLPELVYRTDGNDWSTFTPGTTEITLTSVGDKVYFRSTAEASTFSSSDNKYACFVMSGKIAASGNVMSLISPDCSATKIPCDYCFNSLFSDCASLTAAPELPATELKEYCYRRMFSGCKSLTQAPAKLPAATLADLCYISMFSGCTSLKAAPELPAENLAQGCYDCMFFECTSLEAAPVLRAPTLATNCYEYMFGRCKKLSSITMLATDISASDCLFAFANGVSETGTFWKASGMDEEKLKRAAEWNNYNWEFKDYEGAK